MQTNYKLMISWLEANATKRPNSDVYWKDGVQIKDEGPEYGLRIDLAPVLRHYHPKDTASLKKLLKLLDKLDKWKDENNKY